MYQIYLDRNPVMSGVSLAEMAVPQARPLKHYSGSKRSFYKIGEFASYKEAFQYVEKELTAFIRTNGGELCQYGNGSIAVCKDGKKISGDYDILRV